MNIAIISHAYPIPGNKNAAEFVHGLASAMVKLGHNVYVIIPNDEKIKKIKTIDGVNIVTYKSKDTISHGRADNRYLKIPHFKVFFSLLNSFLKLNKTVKEKKIDIIHAHWAIPSGFIGTLVKSFTNTPLVITMHGRDVYLNPEVGFIVPNIRYIKPFLKKSLKSADKLIAISKDCYNHAKKAGAPEENMSVIYNGVDTDRFYPNKNDRKKILEKLSIPANAKIILTVRSLNYRKGIDVLIDAMPKILKNNKNTYLLIAGDGPEKQNLKKLQKKLELEDKIIFLGHIPNEKLPMYENSCDLFVIPSREEGFGVAAAEAMACGKPVVGTTAGGLKETIKHGVTGLLVEPDNFEQLANSIIKILKDKKLSEKLSKNALEKIEKDYNWMNIAKETIQLYKKCIKQK